MRLLLKLVILLLRLNLLLILLRLIELLLLLQILLLRTRLVLKMRRLLEFQYLMIVTLIAIVIRTPVIGTHVKTGGASLKALVEHILVIILPTHIGRILRHLSVLLLLLLLLLSLLLINVRRVSIVVGYLLLDEFVNHIILLPRRVHFAYAITTVITRILRRHFRTSFVIEMRVTMLIVAVTMSSRGQILMTETSGRSGRCRTSCRTRQTDRLRLLLLLLLRRIRRRTRRSAVVRVISSAHLHVRLIRIRGATISATNTSVRGERLLRRIVNVLLRRAMILLLRRVAGDVRVLRHSVIRIHW